MSSESLFMLKMYTITFSGFTWWRPKYSRTIVAKIIETNQLVSTTKWPEQAPMSLFTLNMYTVTFSEFTWWRPKYCRTIVTKIIENNQLVSTTKWAEQVPLSLLMVEMYTTTFDGLTWWRPKYYKTAFLLSKIIENNWSGFHCQVTRTSSRITFHPDDIPLLLTGSRGEDQSTTKWLWPKSLK